MPAEDPGKANLPGRIQAHKIRWARDVPGKWWRNSHEAAADPFVHTRAKGRLSGAALPHATLYLATNPIACFWESGLGRDLNSRMPGGLSISESDLKARWEHTVELDASGLHLFNAADGAARRSIGARTSACFCGDHGVARAWAEALMSAGSDGILYESTRESPGLCLALFDTAAAEGKLSRPVKIGSAYDNPHLLAQLFAEGVAIIGCPG